MNFFKTIAQLFTKRSSSKEQVVIYPTEISEEQFAEFSPEQRMIAVMKVGDTGEPKYYEFIKRCIEFDSDQNVRFAALKRLPNFSSQKDLIPYLESLDKLPTKKTLEPYLSLALSRLGIISVEEFEERIKGG